VRAHRHHVYSAPMKLGSLCLVSALLLACGGDPSDSNEDSDGSGGSNIDLGSGGSNVPGGAGGTGASSSGGGLAGGSGGAAASGGSEPNGIGGSEVDYYPVPVCDPVPPACPEKVIDGSRTLLSLEELEEMRGVTTITGDLVLRTVEDLSILDCLEDVGERLEIDVDGSLEGGLPRLNVVGYQVKLSSTFFNDVDEDEVSVDCAFQSLVEVNGQGSIDTYSGLTGELDLSRLTRVGAIRIKSSNLSRVKLPNGLRWGLQLAFENNEELRELTGFEQMEVVGGEDHTVDTYILRILENPLLSGCRAQEIETLFRDAQYPDSSIIVEGNGPGCE
jgi:hypothetical protein